MTKDKPDFSFEDLLEQEMMNAMTLRVPLTVEVKKGASWYDAH